MLRLSNNYLNSLITLEDVMYLYTCTIYCKHTVHRVRASYYEFIESHANQIMIAIFRLSRLISNVIAQRTFQFREIWEMVIHVMNKVFLLYNNCIFTFICF